MNNQKKTNQPSIAYVKLFILWRIEINLFSSFFTKKDQPPIISPKKEIERSSISVKNKESPSSDSDDKSLIFAPTKRAKKRVLSFDESDQDQKSNSSNENIKETPTKIVKQMKIIDTKVEIKDENNTTVTKIEQTTTVPIEQKT
jgi:hypothetical protein